MKLRLRWLLIGVMLAATGWAWAAHERALRRASEAELAAGKLAIEQLGATLAQTVKRGELELADRDRVIGQHVRVISQLQGTLARRPVRLHPSDGGGHTPPDPIAVAPVPDPTGCLASLDACRRAVVSGVEPVPDCPAPATVELGMGCFAQQIEAAPGQVAALLYGWAEAATGGLIAKRPDQDDTADGIIEVDGRRMEPLAQVTFKRTEPEPQPLRRMLELRGGVTTGPGFAAGASWYGAQRVGWFVQADYDPDPERLTSRDYADGELLSESTDSAERWRLAFGAAVRMGKR